ncbi:hypothetical protein K470DRAFT_261984 [Piedraia hortae CBS 480.64]|uniref:Uncharacterized protein n=1 Tax=Piedraia hortae CBS 480.64 TaxID=1314780 RepID=A0A6A7C862_9PEZI|nr:hypothetical protein K470DRAFT_261984 [Piedraia hortae CBS 480.64]
MELLARRRVQKPKAVAPAPSSVTPQTPRKTSSRSSSSTNFSSQKKSRLSSYLSSLWLGSPTKSSPRPRTERRSVTEPIPSHRSGSGAGSGLLMSGPVGVPTVASFIDYAERNRSGSRHSSRSYSKHSRKQSISSEHGRSRPSSHRRASMDEAERRTRRRRAESYNRLYSLPGRFESEETLPQTSRRTPRSSPLSRSHEARDKLKESGNVAYPPRRTNGAPPNATIGYDEDRRRKGKRR